MLKKDIHLKYVKPVITEKKISFTLLYGIFDNFPEEAWAACNFPCNAWGGASYCQSCTGFSTAQCATTGECAY
ncbi:hypothetical protein A3D78_01435 [Candidatus Gottesmanbacteria bacterium RIFCSPHIGHO2_02_FULL_39_14]|uniref:Uncharacterized protein n=1 Tax=Candidatus Gottesmanbacteria bacterium RIFCSPHIGHO2_02_FULL_39_14 TaxID=1798383 RepID=A0A1F5ZWE6_9BACT|nr:MAG: hypothetical protein A3D78_01435 [Candidatus Gottesmanbacteria bacterium RIFCSPHIGHO2_02_FULL_39_14]